MENLLDFLHTKARKINFTNLNANDKLKSAIANKAINSSKVESEIYDYLKRQKNILAILNEIHFIQELKLNAEKNKISDPSEILNDYFLSKIKDIDFNNIDFNCNHPLYGYKPFHESMMSFLIKAEKYEQCKYVCFENV